MFLVDGESCKNEATITKYKRQPIEYSNTYLLINSSAAFAGKLQTAPEDQSGRFYMM